MPTKKPPTPMPSGDRPAPRATNAAHAAPLRARKSRTTPPDGWQGVFLRELGIDGNRRRAARAAGVDSATIYRHRADDPAFRELWDTAIDHAGEYLEAEAWRRATEGVVKPLTCAKGLILDKAGRRVTVREYSDTVLLALLRGARPQKYRERASLDLTSGGHSLMEDLALTLARLRDTAADGMLITDGTCDTNPTTPAE